jgi:uncharacterized protein (DUF433 family)
MARIITEMVGGLPYEFYPIGKHMVHAVGVCGGRPTFKYTRIEVAGVLAMLTSNSVEDIVQDYEGQISKEAIEEAILLASKLVKKQRTPKSAAA